MAASGFLEPLDEKVACEMCSLEGVTTLCCLLFHLLLPCLIISDWQKIKQEKVSCLILSSHSTCFWKGSPKRLSSDSEVFDNKDTTPKCLAMTVSMLLLNIMLLVHMVHTSPWEIAYNIWTKVDLCTRSQPAANSWIMEFGTNMQIWALA